MLVLELEDPAHVRVDGGEEVGVVAEVEERARVPEALLAPPEQRVVDLQLCDGQQARAQVSVLDPHEPLRLLEVLRRVQLRLHPPAPRCPQAQEERLVQAGLLNALARTGLALQHSPAQVNWRHSNVVPLRSCSRAPRQRRQQGGSRR
eukprot:1732896-Rhodomonas_salina.2